MSCREKEDAAATTTKLYDAIDDADDEQTFFIAFVSTQREKDTKRKYMRESDYTEMLAPT